MWTTHIGQETDRASTSPEHGDGPKGGPFWKQVLLVLFLLISSTMRFYVYIYKWFHHLFSDVCIVYLYLCLYLYPYLFLFLSLSLSIHLSISIYPYICAYVNIYIYIYISNGILWWRQLSPSRHKAMRENAVWRCPEGTERSAIPTEDFLLGKWSANIWWLVVIGSDYYSTIVIGKAKYSYSTGTGK